MIRIVTLVIGSWLIDRLPTLWDKDQDVAHVGHSTDTQSAPELCATVHPDIALIDLCATDRNDLQAVRAIRASDSRMKLMIFSQSHDPDYVRALLKIGISGYLLCQGDLRDLGQLIRSVYSGQVVCSASITHALLQSFLI